MTEHLTKDLGIKKIDLITHFGREGRELWDQLDSLRAERDALREALGKLAELPVVVTDEYAYRVTEIALRALERTP